MVSDTPVQNGWNGSGAGSSTKSSESVETDISEPIAIVGFGFQYPQEATSVEAFWDMLMSARCAMTVPPENRFCVEAFHHPDPSRRDTFSITGGQFLTEHLGAFDAPFFSMSPAEASAMDPQQPGIPVEKVAGSKTSVYTASFSDDYKILLTRDPESFPLYGATGTDFSILANRISWFFDFNGPSANVDSACSSSLLAIDLACGALRSGDASMSIAAGGALILDPDNITILSNLGLLSPDSRCFSFDHRANGYAKGEGAGVLVLKRLQDAVDAGDVIRAIIRSNSSNQDGHTPGISNPSLKAQEALIRQTYAKAGLDMDLTSYFEAHGTGTSVGDSTEMGAIGASFAESRDKSNPLYVGALKSNIGHLEGGAGIAATIKTILALESGVIPPNANFEKINPNIDAEYLKIKLPLKPTPWPVQNLRRASINSFGFGGSNSHLVLDDAYHYLEQHGLHGNHKTRKSPPLKATLLKSRDLMISSNVGTMTEVDNVKEVKDFGFASPKILVWSAADADGIQRLAQVYDDHLVKLAYLDSDQAQIYLERIAFTLATRRSSLPWKSFSIASSLADMQGLAKKISNPVRENAKKGLAFVFSGQGAQWPQMGKELLCFPIFRNSLADADAYLLLLNCKWSVMAELLKDKFTSRIHSSEISQPLCTVLQVATVDLLYSWGIRPSRVVGHSSGEIAAAYCVGAISRKSAWRIAYWRGHFSKTLEDDSSFRGSMMAVGLSAESVKPYLTQISMKRDTVKIGCINSPKNITLSGERNHIDALKRILDNDGVFARVLRVGVGYHSQQMERIEARYMDKLANLEQNVLPFAPPVMVSSLTGNIATAKELCTAEYWIQNLTSPVRFSEALSRLCCGNIAAFNAREGNDIHDILEIGPHSTLQGPIRETIQEAFGNVQTVYQSSMIRGSSSTTTLLSAIARLYCAKYFDNLVPINHGHQSQHLAPLVDLPQYPFDHSHIYWHDTRIDKAYRFRPQPQNDLLGTRVADWNPLNARWRKFIRISELPWVEDHKINGPILYPGAGMVVMAIEAAKQLASKDRLIVGFDVKDVIFNRSLNIPPTPDGIETQLSLRSTNYLSSKSSGWSEFEVCVYEHDAWHRNAGGYIKIQYQEDVEDINGSSERCLESDHYRDIYREACLERSGSLDSKQTYDYLQNCGLQYGPSFQLLDHTSWIKDNVAVSDVKLFNPAFEDHQDWPTHHIIHPVTLDAICHLLFIGLSRNCTAKMPTMIPSRLDRLWLSSSGLSIEDCQSLKAHTISEHKGLRKATSTITAFSSNNEGLKILINGLETTVVANSASGSSSSDQIVKQYCFDIEWKPDHSLLSMRQLEAYCQSTHTLVTPIHPLDRLRNAILGFISEAVEHDYRHTNYMDKHLCRYKAWMRYQLNTHPRNVHRESLLRSTKFGEPLSSEIETVYTEIGRHLTPIMCKETDLYGVLHQSGLSMASVISQMTSQSLLVSQARYLDLLAHKNPAIRILQIGRGEGPWTKEALKTLVLTGATCADVARFSCYEVTEKTAALLQDAELELKFDMPWVKFRVLDIEQDVESQDFKPGAYDVAIVHDIFHNEVADVHIALQNIYKLLAPNGALVVGDITNPESLRTTFIRGLLPEWWVGIGDNRIAGPILSKEEWRAALRLNGFEAPLFLDDYECVQYQERSLIVSARLTPRQATISSPNIALIVRESSAKQLNQAIKLKQLLACEGYKAAHIVSLGDKSAPIDSDADFWISFLEIEAPVFDRLSKEDFDVLQSLLLSTSNMLWVTAGGGDPSSTTPAFGVVNGLARTLRTEIPGLTLVTLALDPLGSDHAVSGFIRDVLEKTIAEMGSGQYEREFVERDGCLHIQRLSQAGGLQEEVVNRSALPQTKVQKFGAERRLRSDIELPGLLNTLRFVEDTTPKLLELHEIEIEVRAVGLNATDALTATGKLDRSWFGSDCAGTVTRVGSETNFKVGDRVIVCGRNTFRSLITASAENVISLPRDWTWAEGASVPTAFCLAYYALHNIASLGSGQCVLIHSAAGGIGQAAVQIARLLGAEVLVTVGSESKKKLLSDLYDIAPERILYSRNSTSSQGVKRLTSGRGVDVILNTLGDDLREISWSCLAPFGHFVDLSLNKTSPVNLPANLQTNTSYAAFDFSSLAESRQDVVRATLRTIMGWFSEGRLVFSRPLKLWPVSQVEAAFRYMDSGNQVGKSVITISRDDEVKTVLNYKSTYSFTNHGTYLICGGLGGLGRSIAEWMVDRGARNLILLSRSGRNSKGAASFIDSLLAKGIRVEAPACDVTSAVCLKSVLNSCAATLPPIRGAIQAAAVQRDLIFEKMTYEDWASSIACKTDGSWNLHEMLPREGMDFFLLLSSMSGIFGFACQANYAAGNTYLDALALYRRAQGLPAFALNLGPIADIGLLATERTDVSIRIEKTGHYVFHDAPQLFRILEHYCNPELHNVQQQQKGQGIADPGAAFFKAPQLFVGVDIPANVLAKGKDLAPWMDNNRLFALTHNIPVSARYSGANAGGASQSSNSLASSLPSASSLAAAAAMITDGLARKLGAIFSMPATDLDIERALSSYGVDSLIAIEMKNWLAKEVRADIAVFEILGEVTIKDLGELAARMSKFFEGNKFAESGM